jgi:nucleotide-binding universal stress UspA family protein
MYRNILLPLDGSPPSQLAIEHGLALAKALGSRVTLLHVTPTFRTITADPTLIEDTSGDYEAASAEQARRILAPAVARAAEAGVPAKDIRVEADQVYEGIIETARSEGCDLICMASHGRHGIAAILLGSETQKVLTHSTIPVLVYR